MAKSGGNKRGYSLQAIAAVIVALATLEATFLTLYFFSRKTIYTEATRRAVGQLDATDLMITDVLDQVETTVRNNVWPVRNSLAVPDSLWSMTHRIVDCNPFVYGSCVAFTENYNPRIGRSFAPYSYRNGERIDTVQLGKASYGYLEKEWFVKPIETGAGYWSEPYFDEGGGERLMTTYSIPVTDRKGDVAAVLTADVSLDWLTDLVGGVQLYPEAFSVLLSRTGKLMVCPAPAFVMKKTVQEIASTVADSTAVREVSLAMLAGESGNRQVMYKGEKDHVFYAPIDRADWSMAIVIPDDEIYENVRRVGLLVILLQVLGLAVMSYILYATLKNQFRVREMSEKKNLIDSELRIARNIQMSMLPTAFLKAPEHADIDMSAILVPAKEVSGDLYDFYIRDGRLFFCVGDVSGKGVPASLVMAVTRSLFRTVSAHEKSPQRIVSSMNESLADMNENSMFITFFLGVLDLWNGHLMYCNAGHNAPVRTGADAPALLDVLPNLPLGVLPDKRFQEQETVLAAGEGLFLYTDGLTEAEDASQVLFGPEKMLQVLSECAGKEADVQVESMVSAVKNYSGEGNLSDDLTILAVRFVNPDPSSGTERHLSLRNEIEEIPRLHRFVHTIADETAMDARLTMNLNLALEEAVSNVILYAYPDGPGGHVDVDAVIGDDSVVFTITDSGIPFDPTTLPPPDLNLDVKERPVGGLGIFLVRRIMDDVAYVREDGKNILTLTKKRHK